MIAAFLAGVLVLSAAAAEPVFLRPVNWLGDLLVTEKTILLGTTGQVVEVDFQGKVLRTLSFPAGQVQALVLGPDFLAAGGWNFLRLWSWPEGEIRLDIQGFGAMVRELSLAGEMILAAGADGRVYAFSVSDGKLLWTLQAHAGSVWGLAAIADLLATAGNDRLVLWDLSKRTELFSFSGKGWDVDFSPDGYLLAGGVGKILKVWDTAVGLPLWEAWAHESCTVAMSFSPDGKHLATGSLDQTAALWDAETGSLLQRIAGFSAPVGAVRFSPDGKLFVAGAEDGTLALLSLP